MTTTTVNVNECVPPVSTPGNYNVRAFYTETDAGHLYGVFSTREAAEKAVLILAGRTGVVKAQIETV